MRQKMILIVTIFFIGVSCFAQNEARFKTLRDNIAKNEVKTQHPKKGVDPKTWMERGKLFFDAYNANIIFLRFNMPTNEVKLFLKQPRQIITNDDGTEVYRYSQITLNFENDELKTWVETKKVVDNALSESVKAYQKAHELDVKRKNEKKINKGFVEIKRDLESKFFNEFFLSKYVEAYNTGLELIGLNSYMGIVDAIFYFNVGYAAYAQSEIDDSMWKQAIENFEKTLEYEYDEISDNKGQIYSLLHNAYKKIGDSKKSLYYAHTGFEKHPNNTVLIYDLITYYLEHDDDVLALKYVEHGLAIDPKNPDLLKLKRALIK